MNKSLYYSFGIASLVLVLLKQVLIVTIFNSNNRVEGIFFLNTTIYTALSLFVVLTIILVLRVWRKIPVTFLLINAAIILTSLQLNFPDYIEFFFLRDHLEKKAADCKEQCFTTDCNCYESGRMLFRENRSIYVIEIYSSHSPNKYLTYDERRYYKDTTDYFKVYTLNYNKVKVIDFTNGWHLVCLKGYKD